MLLELVKHQEVMKEAKKLNSRRVSTSTCIPGEDSLKAFVSDRKFRSYEMMVRALKPLVGIMDQLEGESYPTLSLIQSFAIALSNIVTNLIEEENCSASPSDTILSFLKQIAVGVKERFLYKEISQLDGYMPLDYIAQALDPRTKDMKMMRSEHKREVVWAHVNGLVTRMMEAEPSEDIEQGLNVDEFVLINYAPSPISRLQKSSQTRRALYCQEVDDFIKHTGSKIQESPLAWWKFHEKKFPHLAELAKTYLAIPASSATVERLFSRAGLVRFH